MADALETPIGTITVAHFQPGRIRHRVFVGPKVCYALFNQHDRLHPVARAFMAFVRDGDLPYRQLIVNEHVVDEAATRLKKRAGMPNAQQFLETLEESSLLRLEPLPDGAFAAAVERFRAWTDHDASVTDFVVASHMAEIGVDHLLTFDRDFDPFELTTLPYWEFQ